jgi:aminocarboxymuconate-semialdehyde decarboxylase
MDYLAPGLDYCGARQLAGTVNLSPRRSKIRVGEDERLDRSARSHATQVKPGGNVMIIDCHAHQLTPGMMSRHPHWGPIMTPRGLKIGDWTLGSKAAAAAAAASGEPTDVDISIKWLERMSIETRLGQMDEIGTDHLVLSVPAHAYMYWAGEFGDEYARIINDELAAYSGQAPDRLSFWGHANIANPAGAVAELDRAVKQLGAVGMSMGGSNFGGLEIYDEALDPVWAKLVELDVPIYVHGYNQSVTWGPDYKKDKFDTTSIVGMNVDEAKAFWYFTSGGVLDRFPDLKIYITHGGGFAPFQLGRFNATNQTMAPDSVNKRPIRDYLPNFYFDLDLHSRAMRQAMIEDIGPDRLLYGTNFGGADKHHGDLCDGLGLTDAEKAKIHSENALGLLRFLGNKKLSRAKRPALA